MAPGQHPWGSWPVPGWLVAVLLDREETKRKRQVAFLTHEVELLRDRLALQSSEISTDAAASKSEDLQEEAGQSRLEMQQELKALSSSSDSEKMALSAQVASLEAELKCVKSEDGAVQALRYQVSRLEEELSSLREKHLQSTAEAASKLTSAEARAADADRFRATLEQQLEEAQRAESELTLLKPRLADLAAQLHRSQQEILELEGDVATLHAAARESAWEILESERVIERLLDEINSKEECLQRLKQENIAREEGIKRLKEHLNLLEKQRTRASFSHSCSSPEQQAKDEATAIQALRDERQRAAAWKQLLLKWHPDKNPQNVQVATRVFQMLQNWR